MEKKREEAPTRAGPIGVPAGGANLPRALKRRIGAPWSAGRCSDAALAPGAGLIWGPRVWAVQPRSRMPASRCSSSAHMDALRLCRLHVMLPSTVKLFSTCFVVVGSGG
jgi:hypothetical protein